MKKIKYIVIAGSSGGHILPALAYINNLSLIKDPNNILFITNEIGKKYLEKIESNKINKIILKSKNKFFFILNLLLKVSFVFLSNRRIILIGFGGFITTPVLIISKLFNIFLLSLNKIYIHEQNVIYGLANKINYFIAKNAFISFPKDNMRSKEIFVGNFFINRNKYREKLDHNFINVLLMGGSAGSIDLNNIMLKEITNFNRAYLKKIKFFIQIPESHIKVLKKKYSDLLDKNNCEFFSFKDDLNPQEYDIILSRSGSGSINEILYYTNNVYFTPHLISRDQHQKFNLDYFLSHDMSQKNFYIPNKKKLTSQFYFNPLINPHSIKKIICYITR